MSLRALLCVSVLALICTGTHGDDVLKQSDSEDSGTEAVFFPKVTKEMEQRFPSLLPGTEEVMDDLVPKQQQILKEGDIAKLLEYVRQGKVEEDLSKSKSSDGTDVEEDLSKSKSSDGTDEEREEDSHEDDSATSDDSPLFDDVSTHSSGTTKVPPADDLQLLKSGSSASSRLNVAPQPSTGSSLTLGDKKPLGKSKRERRNGVLLVVPEVLRAKEKNMSTWLTWMMMKWVSKDKILEGVSEHAKERELSKAVYVKFETLGKQIGTADPKDHDVRPPPIFLDFANTVLALDLARDQEYYGTTVRVSKTSQDLRDEALTQLMELLEKQLSVLVPGVMKKLMLQTPDSYGARIAVEFDKFLKSTGSPLSSIQEDIKLATVAMTVIDYDRRLPKLLKKVFKFMKGKHSTMAAALDATLDGILAKAKAMDTSDRAVVDTLKKQSNGVQDIDSLKKVGTWGKWQGAYGDPKTLHFPGNLPDDNDLDSQGEKIVDNLNKLLTATRLSLESNPAVPLSDAQKERLSETLFDEGILNKLSNARAPLREKYTHWDWIRDVLFLRKGKLSTVAMKTLVDYRDGVLVKMLEQAKSYAMARVKIETEFNDLTSKKLKHLALHPIMKRNSIFSLLRHALSGFVEDCSLRKFNPCVYIYGLALQDNYFYGDRYKELFYASRLYSVISFHDHYVPRVQASSDGSTDVDSDIDLPVGGFYAELVVKEFNRIFTQKYLIESATAFDLNLYAVDGDLFIKLREARVTTSDRGPLSWNPYRWSTSYSGDISYDPAALSRFIHKQDAAALLGIRRVLSNRAWAEHKDRLLKNLDFESLHVGDGVVNPKLVTPRGVSFDARQDFMNKLTIVEHMYEDFEDEISRKVIEIHLERIPIDSPERHQCENALNPILSPEFSTWLGNSGGDEVAIRRKLRNLLVQSHPDIYNAAMNRLYEEKLDAFKDKKMSFDIDTELLLNGDVESLRLMSKGLWFGVKPTKSDIKLIVQDMDKRFMQLATDYIAIGYFANEAYLTGSALVHVVGNMQGNKDIPLGPEAALASFNEQYGMMLHGYHHQWETEVEGTRFGKFLFKTGKYLDRLSNAFLVIRKAIKELDDDRAEKLTKFGMMLSALGDKLVCIKKSEYDEDILMKRGFMAVREAIKFIEEADDIKVSADIDATKLSHMTPEHRLAKVYLNIIERFVAAVNGWARSRGVSVTHEFFIDMRVNARDDVYFMGAGGDRHFAPSAILHSRIYTWNVQYSKRMEAIMKDYHSSVAPLNIKDPVSGVDIYEQVLLSSMND